MPKEKRTDNSQTFSVSAHLLFYSISLYFRLAKYSFMKKYIYILLGAALWSSCTEENYLNTLSETKATTTPEVSLIKGGLPGKLHVKVKGDVLSDIKLVNPGGVTLQSAPSKLSATLNSIRATALSPLFNMDPRFEKRFRQAELDRWYEVCFDEAQDLQQTIHTLTQSKQFAIVEPVYATSIPTSKAFNTTPNETSSVNDEEMPFDDPELIKQWHYHNIGKYPGSVPGADANVFEAWKTETGKPNVIVAIVDGGIDVEHEDLVDNLWVNPGEIPGNGIDDDGNGYVDDIYGWNFVSGNGNITLDGVGHGTHVAGTVAARNNNGIGVGGVAGGDGTPDSGVRLMSCQKFEGNYDGDNTDDIIASAEDAFRYSADNGAVISQNSWGYTYANVWPASMQAAMDYFIQYAGCDNDGNQLPDSPMKGGVVIVAAGNDNADALYYPGAYEPTIAVSAMAPNWERAWYSNYSTWIDIMAPGGDHYFSNGYVYSTLPGNTYGEMAGTSQACPHVSGIAALIVSHFGGQGFTNEDLKERLLSSLRPESIDLHNPEYAGRLGVGYIDAGKALAENQEKRPDNIADIEVEAQYTNLTLQWKAVKDEDDGMAIKHELYLSEQPLTESNYQDVTPYSINTNGYQPGTLITYTVDGLKDGTTYYVGVIAIDRWGLKSDLTTKEVQTLKNDPPVISGLPESTVRVSGTEKQKFTLMLSDPNGHKVSYQVGGETRGVSVSADGNQLHFTIRAVAALGTHNIELTVTDELGASTSVNIPFEVYEYQLPSVLNSIQNMVIGQNEGTAQIDLTQHFSGNRLSYTAQSSDENIATVSVDGTQLTVTTRGNGETSIRVEASDGQKNVQTSFQVRVVENSGDLVYQIYPMPVTSYLNILMNPDITSITVSIRTVNGEEVLGKPYAVARLQPVKVDVRRLAAGVYTLIIETTKGTVKKTFVKQ